MHHHKIHRLNDDNKIKNKMLNGGMSRQVEEKRRRFW